MWNFIYPKWQPPHSARCYVGGARRRFSDEGLPARGSANVSAKSLPRHQKPVQNDPQSLPKCTKILPKSSPDGPKSHQSGILTGNLEKRVPKWSLLHPKVPQEGPKRSPKISKNIKKRSPKIGSKNTWEKTSKKLPKSSKKETEKSLFGRLWEPKRPLDPQSPHSLKPTFSLGKT